MRKTFIIAALCGAAVLPVVAGQLRELPAEKFRELGLHKLTAEELAALESLWAGRDEAVKAEAATKIAAAEARAQEAEKKAAEPAGDPKQPGWLHALITLKRAEEKPDAAGVFESRLAGDFTGWSGHTLFRLENGQVWQQMNPGEYPGKVLPRPAVKIYPGALGTYWLQVEGLRQRVRVKPYKLE